MSKNLAHLFFLSQRPKKGAPVAAEPLRVARAAVLGAGVMGSGIARLLADKGVPVLLKDIHDKAVESGLAQIRESFRKQLSRQGGGEERIDAKMALVTGTTSFEGFDTVDLVIEAVLEKMAIKQSALKETESQLKPTAIFVV